MSTKNSLKRLIDRLKGKISSPEDLLELVEEAKEYGVLSPNLSSLIERIIKIREKKVEEVMVPRVDMVTVKEETPLSEVIKLYKTHGFSKIPVIRERVDNVIGIFYIKELIKHLDEIEKLKVKNLAIKPYFIPDSKNVLDALRELQGKRISIAIVVDEFGSVVGLVTLEDLLEEIVGEIWEEFDREEIMVVELEDGSYLFNTKIELEEASKYLGVELQSEEVHTLGGYILEKLDRVPHVGEKFSINGIEFEVVEATQQRLKKVKARLLRSKE